MAASVASRILRVGRLDAPASVPPLTRPPSQGSLPLGFHRGKLSLFHLLKPFLVESDYDKAISHSVVGQDSARWSFFQQTLTHCVAHEFLDGIAHRTSAEFRMKSLSHEERQNGRVEFQM